MDQSPVHEISEAECLKHLGAGWFWALGGAGEHGCAAADRAEVLGIDVQGDGVRTGGRIIGCPFAQADADKNKMLTKTELTRFLTQAG